MSLSPSGPAVLAVIYTLIGIAAALVAARIYLRLKLQRRRLQASDLWMIAAWCAAFTTSTFDIVIYVNGILRADLNYTLVNYTGSLEKLEYLLRIMRAGLIPYLTTFYLCKASLLAVYLQLFPFFMTKRRIALWVAIAYCAAAYIVTMCLVLFLCFPIDRNWAVIDAERYCDVDNIVIVFQVAWALHFFGSLVLFCLPFLILYKLNMTKHMKVAVYSVFLLGLIDIAFSLTRFLTIQLGNEGSFRSITLIELWSALDAYIGLIVACLPSLRPYLRHDPGKAFQASSEESGQQPTSPKPRRLGQRGFEEMDDETSFPSGNYRSEGAQRGRRESDSPDIVINSTWNSGKRSNGSIRSDVELVDINARVSVGDQVHLR
ncbi:hypothetical protein B0J13DRAFT_67579 [Dactylonectria estremocensis]|uniref:Rhodopsin domain-containing protein n=1 Tax=Dactylonectria estremocensis TaxID=1079267 RepID=A0A9P9ELP6_9HYPO|nr:hypothetical protein B0J13DRAFT_67579 [Dactylonectria estremocensis]